MPDPELTVTDNAAEKQYELRVDGELAGIAAYRREGNRVVFTHTKIDDRFEGQGLGSTLAGRALDDVRAAGREATPVCPFILAYIRRHQQYADLVDAEHRGQVIAPD